MPAKRTRTSARSKNSKVVEAAGVVGKAVGSAVAAIESAVGLTRRPNGYERMQNRAAATDGPASRPKAVRKRTAKRATPASRARGAKTKR